MAIWGYARAESTGGQRHRIEAYASKRGMTLNGIMIEQEGVSGVTPVADRPIGGPLFAKLAKGDIVIVSHFNRLSRSALDALEVVAYLERRGVGLHALDLGGDLALDGRSKFIMTIAEAFAESERCMGDRLGEAIRQRKADDKEKGLYLGGTVPFGFRRGVDGKLVRDKAEQEAIREIIEMKVDKTPLRTIAAAMVAKGHQISHSGVAGILKAHAGEVRKLSDSRWREEEVREEALEEAARASGFWRHVISASRYASRRIAKS